jgi:hypothetical protein
MENNKKKQQTTNNAAGDRLNPDKSAEENRVFRPCLKNEGRADICGKDAGPPKPSYNVRRKAWKAIKKVEAIPSGSRTDKDIAMLEWAKKTTGSIQPMPGSSSERSLSKRQRSQEESLKDAKRAKLLATTVRPYSEVLKDPLVVAVIDAAKEDGSIAPGDWRKVVRALSASFLKIMRENPGDAPSCSDGGWFRNHVKLTACANQRSLDLYKKAISSLGEVWPGAKLEVTALENIPSRPRARAWIPAEPCDPAEILEQIRIGNPKLPAHNWKIAKVEEVKNDFMSVVIIINKESLAELAKTGGIISYGFGTVMVKIYKKDEPVMVETPGPIEDTSAMPGTSAGAACLDVHGTTCLNMDQELSRSMESLTCGLLVTSDSEESVVSVVEVDLKRDA